jgi:cytochrome c-type biogenesis protein
MMEKVLDELRLKYHGQLRVEFIDVSKTPEIGEKHKIKLIPTQIFLDAKGNELFRHEGFFPEKDIVAKWRELGVQLEPSQKKREGDREVTRSTASNSIERLFEELTDAISGGTAVALMAAFAWGVLSIVLSPCHLASIPLVVGYMNDQNDMTGKRAFAISLLFATGILATIAAIGVATALAGHMLGDLGSVTTYAVSAVLAVIGLHLMGIIPFPWGGPGRMTTKRKGLLGALILGLLFGVAIGPCTFAYMAPMLAVAFKASANHIAKGGALLLLYGTGHCFVIVIAGSSTELIQKYLDWNENSQAVERLKRICGALVVAAGVYMAYKG